MVLADWSHVDKWASIIDNGGCTDGRQLLVAVTSHEFSGVLNHNQIDCVFQNITQEASYSAASLSFYDL